MWPLLYLIRNTCWKQYLTIMKYIFCISKTIMNTSFTKFSMAEMEGFHCVTVLAFSQVNHTVWQWFFIQQSLWYSVGRSLDSWRNKWENVQGIKNVYITCGEVDSFTKYWISALRAVGSDPSQIAWAPNFREVSRITIRVYEFPEDPALVVSLCRYFPYEVLLLPFLSVYAFFSICVPVGCR